MKLFTLIYILLFSMTTLLLSPSISLAQQQPEVAGDVIVKLKSKSSLSGSKGFMGKVGGSLHLKRSFSRLNIHQLEPKPGQKVEDVMAELKKDPDVEYVEPNFIIRRFANEQEPSQIKVFSAGEVAAFAGSSGNFTQNSANVAVTQAWSSMTSSTSNIPIVAIIDTGVEYNHSVFVQSGAIWTNPGEIASNGIDDDGNGYIDDVRGWNFNAKNNNPADDEGHGTHVAGIVLGVGQDIFASSLTPAKIKIMPLKFMGADGSGTTADAIAAIYYAVNNGAKVINNSWGGPNYSQSLHDAMTYAYQQNVVMVAAAGNSGNSLDSSTIYPANLPVPSQITIGASDNYDYLAYFSNFSEKVVAMGAPGVNIYSTYKGNTYASMNGTSMAAPFVAGLVALAQREAAQLSGYQMKQLLVNSSDIAGTLKGKIYQGYRVDALKTVQNAKGEVNTASYQPGYTPVAPAGARGPASAQMGGCGTVMKVLDSAGQPKPPTKGGWVIAISMLPLMAWAMMQARAQGKYRRRHDRFMMNSEIKIKMGDRELVGNMNTIGLGGLSFTADQMLEKGGKVTLQIASPDGAEQIQVEGQIVWSEQNKAYGVQFNQAKEYALDAIKSWTGDLAKAGNR